MITPKQLNADGERPHHEVVFENEEIEIAGGHYVINGTVTFRAHLQGWKIDTDLYLEEYDFETGDIVSAEPFQPDASAKSLLIALAQAEL